VPESAPSRLVVIRTACLCLAFSACTGSESQGQLSSMPDRDEIAAAIDEYADVISDFDQVRAIVVATEDRIVFEEYYQTDRTSTGARSR
jgi:hypothetical protein